MQNDRQPLYIQIQEYFKQLITTGKLTENDKIPSEKALMEKFDVSRITVANALSQLAKDGWIYRIPGRGSFVNPEACLNILSTSKNFTKKEGEEHTREIYAVTAVKRKVIGLVFPLLEDFFAVRLIRGINFILKDSEYQLSIVLTYNDKEREKEAIVDLVQKGAAGLIIFPIDAESYNEEILVLKLQKYPFVLVDRFLPGLETNYVCSDNFLGAQLAVNHLWDLGHREIAICSDISRNTITVEERIRGYMEALKIKGSMIDPALILTDFSIEDNTSGENSHPLTRYMKSGLATAYIAINARLGVYMANLASRLGMDIPGDVSILMYDNPSSGIGGEALYTHIDQSEEQIGIRSAQILIELLNNQDRTNEYSKEVLKPSLVVHTSTGPSPKIVQLADLSPSRKNE